MLGSIAGRLAMSSGGMLVTDGLTCHLNADEGVTESGLAISAWADQSGNGHDFAQATGSAQPTLVPSWKNGRAAIQGASGDLLTNATMALTQPNTIIKVVEFSSSGGEQRLYDGVGANRQIYTADSTVSLFAGAFSGSLPVTFSAAATCAAIYNGSSSESHIDLDGSDLVSQTGLNPGTNGIVSTAVGGSSESPVSRAWLGKYARLLFYDRLLTAGELQQNFDYLASYYDIYPAPGPGGVLTWTLTLDAEINGTYTNVSQSSTSGIGYGIKANFVVAGDALVSSEIVNPGYGYAIGDRITFFLGDDTDMEVASIA